MILNRTDNNEEYLKQLFELQQRLIEYEKINNKEDIRKNYASKNYENYDLDEEIWKQYPPNRKYLVSNLGRIKFDGIIQEQTEEIDKKSGKIKWGYLVLKNKSLVKEYIYNFVAYTFLGKTREDEFHVHHITNDGNDNSISNLVLLTALEHSIVHCFKIGNF